MFCTTCGAEIIAREPFCLFCGTDHSGPAALTYTQRKENERVFVENEAQSVLQAKSLRSARRAYFATLAESTVVAIFFILLPLTAAWYATDSPFKDLKPNVSTARFMLILYGVVIGLWLIIYVIVTARLLSKCPRGSYRIGWVTILSLLGILPGVIYSLEIAGHELAKAPAQPFAISPLPGPPPPPVPRNQGRVKR